MNGRLIFFLWVMFLFLKPIWNIIFKVNGPWSYSTMFISETWVRRKMKNALSWWGHPGSPRLSLQRLREIADWQSYSSSGQAPESWYFLAPPASSDVPCPVHHYFCPSGSSCTELCSLSNTLHTFSLDIGHNLCEAGAASLQRRDSWSTESVRDLLEVTQKQQVLIQSF